MQSREGSVEFLYQCLENSTNQTGADLLTIKATISQVKSNLSEILPFSNISGLKLNDSFKKRIGKLLPNKGINSRNNGIYQIICSLLEQGESLESILKFSSNHFKVNKNIFETYMFQDIMPLFRGLNKEQVINNLMSGYGYEVSITCLARGHSFYIYPYIISLETLNNTEECLMLGRKCREAIRNPHDYSINPSCKIPLDDKMGPLL